MIGQTISHYRILSHLGKGGMGVVYVAEDTHLGRQVAVKFSTAGDGDGQFRARFLREARAASALNHPHIAGIYDYGETAEGNPFIVMELVKGDNLQQVLRRGPMPPKEAVRIAAEVSLALDEAHRQGIIHRDIKPTNVVIDERGTVKVLDFGLAKQLTEPAPAQSDPTMTSAQTMAGTVMGTPAYMSPEQIQEKAVGPASDLFALGAVLYECLAGRPPFSGSNIIDVLAAVLHIDPPAPSEFNTRVTPEMDRVALKALAKQPADRYQSGVEFAADLRRILDNMDVAETVAVPVSGPTQVWNWQRMRPMVRQRHWVAILVLAVAGAAWWWYQTRPYHPSPEALRWYNEGVSSIRDGTYFKASKALERAVALDARYSLAHARLAEAWLELESADEAKKQMLLAIAPGAQKQWRDADELYTQALSLTLTGDFAVAIGKYREIVSRTSDSSDAYVDLGRAYEKADQPKEALSAFLEATRRQTQNPAAWLRAAIQYTRLGDFAKAAAAFSEAESMYRSLSNPEGVTEVQLQDAALLNKMGRPAEARALLDQALATSRNSGSLSQQIAVLFLLSNVDLKVDNPGQAETDANQALELARSSNLETLTTRGLIDLGNAFFARGDTEEAKKDFLQALTYARRFHAERNEVRALLSLGSVESQRGETDDSLTHTRQAMAWYQQRGYQRQVAQALLLMARGERRKGDYAAALETFQQQLQLARKLGNQAQVAESAQGVGYVEFVEGRWSEARASYRDEYEASKQSGAKLSVQFGLLDLSDIEWRLGRYEEARRFLAEAGASASKDVTTRIERSRAEMALSDRQFASAAAGSRKILTRPDLHKEEQAMALSILARALAASGARDQATAEMAKAVSLATGLGDPWRIAETGLAQSEVLLSSGDARLSLDRAQAAQNWFAHVGNQEAEWRCWLAAAEAQQILGDRPGSRESAAKAASLVAALGQRWAPEDYRGYLTRRDVAFWRTRLARMQSGGK